MNSKGDLSKSRLFNNVDGTIVEPEQAAGDYTQAAECLDNIVENKYEILGLLGIGGMGAVYLARHLMLGKEVALKTFRSTNMTDEDRLRFQREAQSLAKLNHKNVIQVFDFGLSESGMPYYTMEYLRGQTLAERLIENEPLSIELTLKLFIEACQGLSLAHSKGIIHRDLKPGNIFIETTPTVNGILQSVKIVDFGLASLTAQSLESQQLTRSGTVFGSPPYMSPEQSTGKVITKSADIYSLGCTLFEALTGDPPFLSESVLKILMMHHEDKPPSLRDASGGKDYPLSLERTVATMLAKSANDRQSSMEQVAGELSRVHVDRVIVSAPALERAGKMEDEPDRPSPRAEQRKAEAELTSRPTWLLKLVAALLLLGLGTIWYWVSRIRAPIHADRVSAKVRADLTAPVSGGRRSTGKLPFSTRAEKGGDGREYVCLTIDSDIDPGDFDHRICIPERSNDPGEIWWIAGSPPAFEPSKAFWQNPSNFNALTPLNIKTLDFRKHPITANGYEILRQIGRQRALEDLRMDDSEIVDRDLNGIKGLNHLRALSLSKTDIHGAALAKLPWIKQLVFLGFSTCQGAGDLLAAVKGSQKLTDLYLDGDVLSHDDFKTISTFSNLTILHVNDSGMTNEDLANLSSLNGLQKLDALNCHIDEKAIETLRQMSKNDLKTLKLNASGWFRDKRKEVEAMIPGAQFVGPSN